MMSRHSMFTCLFIVGASEGDEVHSKSIFFSLNDKSFPMRRMKIPWIITKISRKFENAQDMS